MNHNATVDQFIALLLVSFVVALASRRLNAPYALVLVVTGLALGLCRVLPQAHLDPSVVFTVFLPPLLFESALHLRIKALQADWKAITLYTFLGTFASTFIVGWLASSALRIPLAAGLVFGALASPTDPISVIAIFKRLGAGRRLTLIVDAESLFNDNVAVVLFTVTLAATAGGAVSAAAGAIQFVQLMAGGTLVGIAIGLLASRLHFRLDDHLIEITLTTLVAFGSYLVGEALHVSGVMAVIAAGITLGNYGMQTAMSPRTRLAVAAFWEYMAFVVNSIVFLLIGVEVVHADWAHHIQFTVGAILFLLIGRASIYPISLVVNWIGGDVPRAWQHILWWGGLRGALSMALALGLNRSFPAHDAIISGTFGVVLFSLLVQGTTIGPLLKRLNLCSAPSEPTEQRALIGEFVAVNAALAELDRIRTLEAHPNWSIELLAQRYRDRLTILEKELQSAQPNGLAQYKAAANRAHATALAAEKVALAEAERSGLLEGDDWRDLGARIDAELLALHSRTVEEQP